MERVPPFVSAAFSDRGLADPDGRSLIWGKFRRMLLSLIPPLARYLQKHYGLSGNCAQCGNSCRLLFQCPHLDASGLCTVYDDRPSICRTFPITPADIRDRNIAASGLCGYRFVPRGVRKLLGHDPDPREALGLLALAKYHRNKFED